MSNTRLVLYALGVASAAVAGYVVSCWLWPFARCWRCEGSGRWARGDGKVWRPCRWCKGSGRRLRIGRWLYNRAVRTRREAGVDR